MLTPACCYPSFNKHPAHSHSTATIGKQRVLVSFYFVAQRLWEAPGLISKQLENWLGFVYLFCCNFINLLIKNLQTIKEGWKDRSAVQSVHYFVREFKISSWHHIIRWFTTVDLTAHSCARTRTHTHTYI